MFQRKNPSDSGWLRFILALAVALPAPAASSWRLWTKADGLPESVIFGLTSAGPGHLVVKLGEVPNIDMFDGYQMSAIPSPHVFGRFLGSPDNELWTFDAEGIKIRDASGWHSYPDADIKRFSQTSSMARTSWFMYSVNRGPDDRMDVVPLAPGTGLIMFPDRLVEWTRASGQKEVLKLAAQTRISRFRDIREAAEGGYWLTGDRGIAHLGKTGKDLDWHEFPAPAGFRDLVSPIEGSRGEVFVSVQRPDGRRAVTRFSSGRWEEVYTGGKGQLRGWRGPEGSIWIQNERKILQLGANPPREAGDRAEITGLTTAVVTESGGAFWLATTEGLARYSPPLWRTPPETAWADDAVSAITGDREGRVWFLSAHDLGVNDHGTWSRFALPPGTHEAVLTDNIVVLETGEIAIRGNSVAEVIVFDPRSSTFRTIKNMDGMRTGWIGKRRAGGAWAQVFDDDSRWHLDVFDGHRFVRTTNPTIDGLRNLRMILDAQNGDIWLGTSGALAVIRNGRLRMIGTKDGFSDNAAFSGIEIGNGHIVFGGRNHVTEYDGKNFRVLHDIDLAESMCEGPDGTIWIGSGSGIHRYRPGRWITNTTEDGLPSPAVRKVYADMNNQVWAGTGRGISLLHPEADPDPPMTRIVDDRNLRETPPGGEVRLAFSALDKWKFTAPERMTFSWRMDDSPWSDFVPSQFASFNGLHSGVHKFEVRAMDRNGNIDPSPAQYLFTVLTPWYLQKEFLLFAAIAVFLIAMLWRFAWRHHRRMEFQSRHDALTGLANRVVFEVRFQQAVAAARAENGRVAMLLLDLDRFKPINDTLGHVIGDLFLKEVSARLRAAIRKQDTLARLGGDEFAIVMPGLRTAEEAEWMAQDILRRLREPYFIDSYELAGSASIGISLFPDHGDDAATLQRLADMAMYRCKAQNKDEYAVFDAEVNRIDFRSAEMAGLIREALEMGYFKVRYQPLLTPAGAIAGFEALIRLDHPRFGPIPPGDFIPIAEDTGLITRVGDWVLREACTQMVRWQEAGHRGLRVSVNVSTLQVMRPDFAEGVEAVLRATGLDPYSLTLEITETAMMRNWEQSRTQMKRLRSHGINIALDDFGTGYSTLNSLQLLPIDYVKIDRVFTERIGEKAESVVVIQAIVTLAHTLGFEVIAEGVESPEQFSCLTAVGCDLLQGFLLGSPLSPEETEVLLASAGTVESAGDSLRALSHWTMPAAEETGVSS